MYACMLIVLCMCLSMIYACMFIVCMHGCIFKSKEKQDLRNLEMQLLTVLGNHYRPTDLPTDQTNNRRTWGAIGKFNGNYLIKICVIAGHKNVSKVVIFGGKACCKKDNIVDRFTRSISIKVCLFVTCLFCMDYRLIVLRHDIKSWYVMLHPRLFVYGVLRIIAHFYANNGGFFLITGCNSPVFPPISGTGKQKKNITTNSFSDGIFSCNFIENEIADASKHGCFGLFKN